MNTASNDPLHGITLKAILESLVEEYGWNGMARFVDINCFKKDPSISSSLKFLRKTSWAREKVESLYIRRFVAPRPERELGDLPDLFLMD